MLIDEFINLVIYMLKNNFKCDLSINTLKRLQIGAKVIYIIL